jgi:hypothetical protein
LILTVFRRYKLTRKIMDTSVKAAGYCKVIKVVFLEESMKDIFAAAAMFLLVLSLCSCGGGSDTVDCPGSTSSVQPSVSKAVGAATLSAIQSGESSYAIQGTDLDGIAGIQIDITYDAASLATPTVTQGAFVAGAMLVANTLIPGLIKIAIISTHALYGSGEIATVSFASRTGSGGITLITTSMIDSIGTPIGASTSTPATGAATSVAGTGCR